EKPVLNNSNPVQEVTQEKLVPEGPDFVPSSTPLTDLNNLGDLPEGDPDGVDGGLQNGSGNGGFGPGGNGIPGNGPIDEKEFRTLGVELPVLIRRIQPDYPKLALAARIQGTVVLRALISRTGDVQNVTILKTAHPLLNQSAIEAVSQWQYKPATLGSKPIAVFFQVTVVFTIR
ncbi:energy transducer TonB, partial [bacterium]|nr:energy transducer TonB [bacterium]